MATSNFHRVNADKVYVVTEESVEVNYCGSWHEAFDEIAEDFHTLLGWEFRDDLQDWNELRSYPSHVLGVVGECEVKHKYSEQLPILVSFQPVVRSGYYEHANIDVNYCISFDMCDYNDNDVRCGKITDIVYDELVNMFQCTGSDKAPTDIEVKQICIEIAKAIIKLNDEFNSACEKIADDTLLCTGVFSNGEAIYEKADSNKAQIKNELLKKGLL